MGVLDVCGDMLSMACILLSLKKKSLDALLVIVVFLPFDDNLFTTEDETWSEALSDLCHAQSRLKYYIIICATFCHNFAGSIVFASTISRAQIGDVESLGVG